MNIWSIRNSQATDNEKEVTWKYIEIEHIPGVTIELRDWVYENYIFKNPDGRQPAERFRYIVSWYLPEDISTISEVFPAAIDMISHNYYL